MFTYEKFYKLKFQEFKQQFLERQNMFGVYPQDCLDEKISRFRYGPIDVEKEN